MEEEDDGVVGMEEDGLRTAAEEAGRSFVGEDREDICFPSN